MTARRGPADATTQDNWVASALLVLRLAVGSTYLLHGLQNLFGVWTGWDTAKMAGYLEPKGFGGASTVFAWILAVTETLAGLALLLGVFTALGASLVVIMMATSASLKLGVGFFMPGGFEWELAVLACGLAVLLAGAGKWSIDAWKIPSRTVSRVRTIALGITIVMTLVMVVVTWGSPPPHVQ
ncbi:MULTISPECIES: DoxX family protein [Polymorphospora]|uniref:DoxX family protein n=1 Tax=Polymorphospora lycopeni TaxID=3140240 RepID=A0ABV5CTT8_9ACTN